MRNLQRLFDRATPSAFRLLTPRTARQVAWLVLALVVSSGGASAAAQELWEFSPYRIRVWLAPAPHAMMTPGLRDEVARTLESRAEAEFGSAWEITSEEPPPEFFAEASLRLESLAVAQLVDRAQLTPPKKPRVAPAAAAEPAKPEAASSEPKPDAPAETPAETPSSTSTPKRVDSTTQSLRELFQEDKLFVVSIVPNTGDWIIRCRELDCRSRAWSAIQERRISDLSMVAVTIWDVIQDTFRPVARLESAKDKTASWRLRAGGLVVREDCPLFPAVDSLWRPYIRLNDRLGEPRLGVVPPLPWTFAVAKSREGTLLTTEVHTGVRNALLGRTTSRTQRFALQVRPVTDSTVLNLRSTDKTAETMSGYDVLAKDPRSEDTQPMGRTDWRGSMLIPAADYPLRVLYIKNGNQLLARLPMIPGLEPTLTADLAGDDRRLQAEGFVTGMQGKIMDLVARRAIVATRIKKRANEGRLDEAAKLLEEFRALPSKEDITRQLDQTQIKLTSPNKRVQDKIDRLFNDTRKLLDKFVLSNQLRQLEAEVGGLGGGGPAASPAANVQPKPPAPKSGDGRAAGVPMPPQTPPQTPPPQTAPSIAPPTP